MKTNKYFLLFIWFLIGFSILNLFNLLSPLLQEKHVAGWDSSGHYFLYLKFIELIKSGSISTFSTDWFAGIPLFKLYPPLYYFFASLPHLSSFGAISKLLSFNLFIFFLPLIFCFSLSALAKEFGPEGSFELTFLISILSFFLGSDFGHFGIALSGMILIGLLPSFLGVVFLNYFILFLSRTKISKKNIFFAGIFLSFLILTHTLASIFSFIFLVFYFLFKPKQVVNILKTLFIAAVISSIWWASFLKNLEFSSGVTIGGTFGQFENPLFVVWPNVDLYLKSYKKLFYIQESIVNIPFFSNISISAPMFFTELPLLGLILLLAGVIGSIYLLRTKKFYLPALVCFLLAILTFGKVLDAYDTGIHFYRFIQQIFYLNIFFSGIGLACILYFLNKLNNKYFLFAIILKGFFCFYLILTFLISNFFLQDWNRVSSLKRGKSKVKFRVALEDFPLWEESELVIDAISSLNPSWRIAVENNFELVSSLGSPHYFSSFIPIKTNMEVVTGLLSESSISSEFINSTIASKSKHLIWHNEKLYSDQEFISQSLDSMIQRLKLYNVGYILATSKKYQTSLNKISKKILKRIFISKNFILYEILNKQKLEEKLVYKPFLFLENKHMTFKEFSRIWFKNTKLFAYPVVGSYKKLTFRDVQMKNYSGIISPEKETLSIIAGEKKFEISFKDSKFHEKISNAITKFSTKGYGWKIWRNSYSYDYLNAREEGVEKYMITPSVLALRFYE